MDDDEIIAIRLQKEEEEEFERLRLSRLQEESDTLELALKLREKDYLLSGKNTDNLIDLDPLEPNPDLHGLFLAFNQQYFWGQLSGVEVRWSNKMTLCAGLCEYQNGGYICIKISEPLLKFRPQSDMIDTLLHEMIHAYLFVTHNIRDHSGHGPEFHKHMHRINAVAGTNITIYHKFHDEVNYYKTHVWKCNGPCQHKPPYYGIVKRSMNRKPQKADSWFETHQITCGGTFIKISEPSKKEGKGTEKKERKGKRKMENEKDKDNMTLDKWNDKWNDRNKDEKNSMNKKERIIDSIGSSSMNQDNKSSPIRISDDVIGKSCYNINNETISSTVRCPICGIDSIKADEINDHIDLCIWMTEQAKNEKESS